MPYDTFKQQKELTPLLGGKKNPAAKILLLVVNYENKL